jgi:hypothetical protein
MWKTFIISRNSIIGTCGPHEPIDFVMRAITVNDYDKVREFVVREFPRNEPTCQVKITFLDLAQYIFDRSFSPIFVFDIKIIS